MSKETVAAQFDEQSPLYQRFKQWENAQGFETTSEAVREAIRRSFDNRPSGLLARFVYDAKQDLHKFLFIAVGSLFMFSMSPPFYGVEYVFAAVAVIYGAGFSVAAVDRLLGNRLVSTPSSPELTVGRGSVEP